MSTSVHAPVSAAAAARRENARNKDGKFGEQNRAEADIDLPELTADVVEHVTIVEPVFSDMDKEQRLEAMAAAIEKGVENIYDDPAEMVAYLDFARRFHQYSFMNQLLIRMQCPDATHVASATTWKDAGGSIRKGAKAIWIRRPVTVYKEKTDANGNQVFDAKGKPVKEKVFVGTTPTSVFDISDIEGVEAPPVPGAPDLLEGEAPAGMVDDLTRVLEEEGFPVSYEPVPGRANGYTDFGSRRVVIDSSLSPRQQAKTLAHEMGHVLCGHEDRIEHYHQGVGGERDIMEMEAECLSYMVSREYELSDAGDYSFAYVRGWAQKDPKAARASADKVMKTAKSVLERVAPAWQPEPIPELVAAREAAYKEKAAKRRSTARKKTTTRKAAKAAA